MRRQPDECQLRAKHLRWIIQTISCVSWLLWISRYCDNPNLNRCFDWHSGQHVKSSKWCIKWWKCLLKCISLVKWLETVCLEKLFQIYNICYALENGQQWCNTAYKWQVVKWVTTCMNRQEFPGKEKLNFHFHTRSMTLYVITRSMSLKWRSILWQPLPQKQRKCQGELECYKFEGAWRLAVMETINKLVQHHRWITLLQLLLQLVYIFDSVSKIVRWPTYAYSQEIVYHAYDG